MFKQVEGSIAVAECIACCRPSVICAYPITPQTHIVEHLSEMVNSGKLKDCDFLNVESEMSALSVAIGSSMAGVRSYTATSSQGLLYMMEAVYNTSGMNLPIVMTLGNRAIGSPINIWNDHSDAMSVRDAGWIMIFATSNQEAADLHMQAFKIAESLQMPVMVCVDGFILTHAFERLDIPTQDDVDRFLPPFDTSEALNIEDRMSFGAMVPPNLFTEVKVVSHEKYKNAVEKIVEISNDFEKIFQRNSGGIFQKYKTEGADTIIFSMGSVFGTICDVIDDIQSTEICGKIGAISLNLYRPLPEKYILQELKKYKRVIVLEKAFAIGKRGVLVDEIQLLLRKSDVGVYGVVAGLGGRAITKDLLIELLRNELSDLKFLDLNVDLCEILSK